MLFKSISGENAFLISQGYYKVLRLPKGTYKYQIFNRPRGALRWQPSIKEAVHSGVLKWQGRRAILALK